MRNNFNNEDMDKYEKLGRNALQRVTKYTPKMPKFARLRPRTVLWAVGLLALSYMARTHM